MDVIGPARVVFIPFTHLHSSYTNTRNVVRYASVAVVWIEYVCKYMNSKEVNMLLKDFLRHVSPNRACVLFYCLMHIPIFYK